MQSCELEAVYMGSMLSELNEAGAVKVFPELETVAIASIYGPNSDLWYRYLENLGGDHTILIRCMVELDMFLLNARVSHRHSARYPSFLSSWLLHGVPRPTLVCPPFISAMVSLNSPSFSARGCGTSATWLPRRIGRTL